MIIRRMFIFVVLITHTMKQFRQFLALIAALVMAAVSCQQAPFLTMNGPKSFNFSKDGGSQSFTFSTNKDWLVRSSESWCKVSPSFGSAAEGNVTVAVTVDKNPGYDPRTCTLTVKVEELTETVSVSQDMGLGLIVSPTTMNLTNAAQDFEIEVQKNVAYTVTISEKGKSFITYNGTKALSSEKASFSIAANDTYDDREGVITFQQTGGDLVQTVTVKQSQTDGLIVPDENRMYSIDRDGDTIGIPVQTNVELEVVIPEEAKEWIKRVDSAPTKGLVSEVVYLEVAENTTYYNREAYVVIKKSGGSLAENILIKQAQTDALFIADESKEYSIGSKGGDVTVNVFHNVPFEVDKTNLPDWIAITTADKDAYNATISVSVKENTLYKGRSASITIKGGDLSDSFTINEHQVDIVYTDLVEYKVGWKGGDFIVKVYSNVDYELENPEWVIRKSEASVFEDPLKVTEITFSIGENLDFAKEGQIIIKWNNEGSDETNLVSLRQENCTISLGEPGSLLSEITTERVSRIRVLSLLGSLNGSDIIIIRRMSNLVHLDMRETHIVEGGAAYYKEYVTENNIIGRLMFSNCFQESEASIILPDDVIEIKSEAFSGCHKLVSVSLPSQLRILADYTFPGCWVLKDITLPEGLTYIGLGAFDYCRALEEIVIPSTVKTIDNYAFRECTSLTKIRLKALPTTLTSIGSDLFVVRQNARQIYDNATLFIPKGTLEAYYYTDFGNFTTIVEE